MVGQTVVITGGSGGIGLETARQARAEQAEVILAAWRPGPAASYGTADRAAELAARADAELRVDLSQVPLDRAGA